MGLADVFKKPVEEKRVIKKPSTKTMTSKHFRSTTGQVFREDTSFTFSTMREMLHDPLIQFAFHFLTLGAIQTRFEVAGENKEQKDFIQWSFLDSDVLNETLQAMRWGIAFGFAPFELLWKILIREGREWAIPRVPQLLRWEDADLLEYTEKDNPDRLGDFKGIHYQNRGTSSNPVDIYVNEYKAMWFTWQYHRSNDRYGYPQLRSAWDAWRFRRYAIFQDLPHYLERKADPPFLCKYPEGEVLDPDSNEQIDNADYALEVLGHIRNGSNVAVPSETDPESNAPLWDIQELSTDDRTPIYDTANSRVYLPEILYAMLTPPRTLTEGQYGTKAESETQATQWSHIQNAQLDDYLKDVNRHMIAPALAFNFTDVDPKVKITHAPVKTKDQAATQAVVQTIMQKYVTTGEIDEANNDRLAEITGFRLYPIEKLPDKKAMIIKPDLTEEGEPAGVTADKKLMYEHEYRVEDPRITLERIKKEGLKLWRKPNEMELSYYTEKQLIVMLTRQIEDEATLIDEFENIVNDQQVGAEAFIRKTWKDTRGNLGQRMGKINNFVLRHKTDVRMAIKNWIEEQTYNAAYNAFEEQNALKLFPDRLTGLTAAWVISEPARISARLINDLEAKVKTTLTQSIMREDDVVQAVKVVNDVFEAVKDSSTMSSVAYLLAGLANECIAHGREMLLERKKDGSFKYNGGDEDAPLGGSDEIVTATRSAVMDQNTCEVCKKLDQATMGVDDPRWREYKAPQLCQGNWPKWGTRCRCLMFMHKRSMREAFREINVKPYPAPLLPAGMRTGAFSRDARRSNAVV